LRPDTFNNQPFQIEDKHSGSYPTIATVFQDKSKMTLQVILAPVGVSRLYGIASYCVPGYIEKCPSRLEIGPTGTMITSIVVLVELNRDS